MATISEEETLVREYIIDNIKSKSASAFTPQNNLWFRRLNNNRYIGGTLDIVLTVWLNEFGAVQYWGEVDL